LTCLSNILHRDTWPVVGKRPDFLIDFPYRPRFFRKSMLARGLISPGPEKTKQFSG
jgi:hypothetical protein